MSDAAGPESAGVASAGGQGIYVLDASALLCLLNDEPGSERVAALLSSAVISAVDLAEVASKLSELGADAEATRTLLAPLHLSVVPFDEKMAYVTATLRSETRGLGLSLGDKVCMALCSLRGGIALTTDQNWADAGKAAGVAVEQLR